MLIQHGIVRWATVEEGPVERTSYECLFDDVYPLIRYGKEIQLAEKYTGSTEVICLNLSLADRQAGSLIQYIMMQGRQRIKDIIAALTDPNDIDHHHRLKTLQMTLKNLLNEQYLRTVNWWHIMPADDLVAKITLEEEKKLRSGSTSASLTSKSIKEAKGAMEKRIIALKHDDKFLESLKRKASEKLDLETHRKSKRRRIEEDEESDEFKFDFDVLSPALIIFKTGKCKYCCGP